MVRRALFLAAPVVLLGCSDAPPAEEAAPQTMMVEGACGEAFGGTICTWAELEGDRLVRFGANIPMATVENAPPDAEMLWPPVADAMVALPDVAVQQIGAHSLKFYWEAHGHPPGPYLVPHFDFHIYTVAQAQVDAMDCVDVSKPEVAPSGYVLPDVEIPELGMLTGLCVPEMGMHAIPQTELESDEPFDGTMVIGYYAGEPVFYEPMISQAMLMQRQGFELAMPDYAVPEGVVLPTAFHAEYDEAAGMYRFIFSGFGAAEE